jgi:hypothetical protein
LPAVGIVASPERQHRVTAIIMRRYGQGCFRPQGTSCAWRDLQLHTPTQHCSTSIRRHRLRHDSNRSCCTKNLHREVLSNFSNSSSRRSLHFNISSISSQVPTGILAGALMLDADHKHGQLTSALAVTDS